MPFCGMRMSYLRQGPGVGKFKSNEPPNDFTSNQIMEFLRVVKSNQIVIWFENQIKSKGMKRFKISKENTIHWNDPKCLKRTLYIETIHNNYLEKKGSVSRSVVKASRRRDSICWECRNTVDNKFDYECNHCGWIICSNCGACKQFGCV